MFVCVKESMPWMSAGSRVKVTQRKLRSFGHELGVVDDDEQAEAG
jgi:hypothetical protein